MPIGPVNPCGWWRSRARISRHCPRCSRPCGHRPERYVLFCDDLSFEAGDASYRSLKAMLEGGVEGRPANTLFYATSNRRHLMARAMIENERSTSISPSETVEEKVSMSDRFGLWLGFPLVLPGRLPGDRCGLCRLLRAADG